LLQRLNVFGSNRYCQRGAIFDGLSVKQLQSASTRVADFNVGLLW